MKKHWILLIIAFIGIFSIVLIELSKPQKAKVTKKFVIDETEMNKNQRALLHLYTLFVRPNSCNQIGDLLKTIEDEHVSFKIINLGAQIQKYLCLGTWNSENYNRYGENYSTENAESYIVQQNIALQQQKDSLFSSIVNTIVELYYSERCEFTIKDEQFQWGYLRLLGVTPDTLNINNLQRDTYFQRVMKRASPLSPPDAGLKIKQR
jgi:hypothetical protein